MRHARKKNYLEEKLPPRDDLEAEVECLLKAGVNVNKPEPWQKEVTRSEAPPHGPHGGWPRDL